MSIEQPNISRRGLGRFGAAAATLAAVGAVSAVENAAKAQAKTSGTIKVGILHSLSGTMAISETTLKDTILMLIDAQNKKGGILGRKLERWSSTRPRTGRCSPRRRAS